MSKTTLYFTKRFLRGLLKGITINESLTFVSPERAIDWVKGVRANCKDYELVDHSFQKYWRD